MNSKNTEAFTQTTEPSRSVIHDRPRKPSRWLAPWRDSAARPVIYHCITRVVDRRLVFGPREKEQIRIYMRMYENFSGCRILSYCLMSNHLHLLIEVPPLPFGGLTDEQLLDRLRAIYSPAFVNQVALELADARQQIAVGLAKPIVAERIHQRFTYRMHDLGHFMKTFLQRCTRWFNHQHERTGTLWESRFKSVLVEDGTASTTIAAYIDLNPVRAGIVTDPADYRWSSYGEAIGGNGKGTGQKARAGLVRALMAHKGCTADATLWKGDVSRAYRILLIENAVEKIVETVNPNGEPEVKVFRKGLSKPQADAELERLIRGKNLSFARILHHKIRYFSDGAVIGSRSFIDEVFHQCRDRFGPSRNTGARKLTGPAAPASGHLWTLRDLKKGLTPTPPAHSSPPPPMDS